MSGIPYNRLQTVEATAKTSNGETVVIETLHYAFVVPCRDCKHGHETYWPAFLEIPSDYLDCTGPLVKTWDEYHDVPKDNPVRPDGFCAWGERRDE